MKSSVALRKARKLISSGKEQFVCAALILANDERSKVKEVLKRMFGGRPVDSWLSGNCEDFNLFLNRKDFKFSEYSEAMRAYRLRWIDWMIEGYKKAGD